MISLRQTCLLLAASALAGVAVSASFAESKAAEDWPQFRGHQRDGISPATGLIDAWPEDGPKELWRKPIGEGFSGISVASGRLFTMFAEVPAEEAAPESAAPAEGSEEAAEEKPAAEKPAEKPKTEYAVAYDATTGDEVWRTLIGSRIVTQFGNGPRSTPTVDGEVVYFLGAHGELVALAAADGGERWKVSLEEAFGTSLPYWGHSTSTLVEGELLIVESSGPEGKAYAALDKSSGEVRWTAGESKPSGTYNSPLAITLGDQRQLVFVGHEAVRSIDLAGQELWSHPWPSGETHAMALFVPPNRFFVSGTEGIGAALLQVNHKGDATQIEEVWKSRVMRNHFSSSVLVEGHVYGFDNATLKCISVDDGEQKWVKRGFGKGSLIYADGHLLVLSDRGKLAQIEATPEAYVEKGRVQALEGRCWTAPSLAGGKLYLRGESEIVSYDLKG